MNSSSKHLALLAVALLVLTAGCGGAGSPSTTGTPTSQGPDGSTSASPTSQAPGTTVQAPELSFPEGFNTSGIDQGVRVMMHHFNGLENVSYTVSMVRGGQNESGVGVVNPGTDSAYLNYTVGGTPIEIYAHNGSGHRRMVEGDNVTIEETTVTLRAIRQVFAVPAVTDSYATATYGYRGTTTHDGDEVHRYEITGVRSAMLDADPGNFSNLSGYMEVRPDGLVVDYRWAGEYQGIPRVYEYTLTDLNATTVTRPEWVPEDGTGEPNGTDTAPTTTASS